jgi:cobalt-zinc-cadmium efflux system membrane fusion protein
MDLPNTSGKYKPEMLAAMTVSDGAEPQRLVPARAIVREDNKDCVFVQSRPGTFALRPVVLGLDLESNRVLTAGVQPGEKLVLDGAFHLNNERKRIALTGAE